jgi:hypothetical protein
MITARLASLHSNQYNVVMDIRRLYRQPIDVTADCFPQVSIAFMTSLWGLIVLLPMDSFQSSSGFSVLQALAPEWVVGKVFLLAGLINLHSLFLRCWHWVWLSSAILMVMWAMVGLMFITASVGASSWVLIIGLAWLFGWSAADAKQRF